MAVKPSQECHPYVTPPWGDYPWKTPLQGQADKRTTEQALIGSWWYIWPFSMCCSHSKRLNHQFIPYVRDQNSRQMSANYNSWAKSGLPPVYINKVLLELSPIHSLHIVYGCFPAIKAELSDCNRGHMTSKAKSNYYLQKKKVQTSALGYRLLLSTE